jgi:two-component system, NtrC family, response regulator AtoC
VMSIFMEYDWPGNIRELENMIKRIVILQDEQVVLRDLNQRPAAAAIVAPTLAFPPRGEEHLTPKADFEEAAVDAVDAEPPALLPQPAAMQRTRLADVGKAAALEAERRAIEQALEQTRWNRKRAAEQLDVSYKTLLNRIKECGINRD